MSHRAHLPPSAHTTFVTEGAVVCSFLPRPLEQDADALRVPFFHRNTDYDEFIFYHDGDFFSKDNIKPGMRHAASARHPSRAASQGAGQPEEEDAHRRVRRDAGRAESDPRAAGGRTGGVERILDELDGAKRQARPDADPAFVIINPAEHDYRNIYKLMVGVIVPRPIAFVSTISADGIRNLAPFSFFTGISANPPVICFSPDDPRRGRLAQRHAAQHRSGQGIRGQRGVGGIRRSR